MSKGQDLYKRAKEIIPGGTQLLSKRPEMFAPDIWPPYYTKAKGCEVWDMDGNKYIDTSLMGVGSCTIGYADEDINKAVSETITAGSMCTLNSPVEVELAECLLDLHPWAGKVRYARTGGESMSIAVRIARAATKKDKVLVCGYHGWHDWYLSANLSGDDSLGKHLITGLSTAGLPSQLEGTVIPFLYNDVEGLEKLLIENEDEIAAVVTEPLRNMEPTKEFLEVLSKISKRKDIILVLDEVSYGWRMNLGGAHLRLGIEPNIAVFAKGISNGYPMGAIIGTDEVMNIAEDTFISSTYWTESIGPTAALATIKKMKEFNVQDHIMKIGKKVMEGWDKLALKHGLEINTSGFYPVGHFGFKHEQALELKTIFTQLMLEKGFLATTGFYVSYAHKDKHVDSYLRATDECFKEISKAINEKSINKLLKGPVCHAGFKRLN
ncbi:MAG: aminotransferase class III-fold pyridoxal phosphate-dependent enzyme [Salinivirgaceae bacterium]|jgi:glutamate-1-semialdehyde 2,1-aminomutase|nr:aminotransferase class III-fold pyridoxal phosphate-dependent enzyme [Salinivirgaceae bacterium]